MIFHMDYVFNHSLQDGKLNYNTGRIIIYEGAGIKSSSLSTDHNDLITAFAGRHRVNRCDVASRAYRFYWEPLSKGKIIICPVRKLDEDWVDAHTEKFDGIINNLFEKA
jgi:hypothetical protein